MWRAIFILPILILSSCLSSPQKVDEDCQTRLNPTPRESQVEACRQGPALRGEMNRDDSAAQCEERYQVKAEGENAALKQAMLDAELYQSCLKGIDFYEEHN